MGVVSEGSSSGSVSVESDVHSLAEGTGGGAITSPSPGLDDGADCSHAGSREKASDSLGVVLEVEMEVETGDEGTTKSRIESVGGLFRN